MNKGLKLAYIPKIWTTLCYLVLLMVVFILFLGRKKESLQIDFLMNNFQEFYTHISNFSISFMFALVAGYMSVLQTGKLKFTMIVIGFIILANLFYENFLTILNTPDQIDAIYGIVGAILPIIYLIVHQNWGIIPNPNS